MERNNDDIEEMLADMDALSGVPMPSEDSKSHDPLDDLSIYIRDPDLVEVRVPEFKHTSWPCLLMTMDLGISMDAPILTNFSEGGALVEGRIEEYFREIYIPHAQDEELYLPAKYQPYDAVGKAYNLDLGKPPDTELGKYLAERTSPLIIQIDSLYRNFRAKSWFVKFWMIDECKKFAYLKGGLDR